MPNVFDAAERIPLPADLQCPACDAPPFGTQLALRGHAAVKHGIKFEVSTNPTAVARLAKLKAIPRPETLEQLHPWQMIALAQHELYGMTYKEIVDNMRDGKGEDSLTRAAQSPAGKAYRAQMREMAADSKLIFKHLMESARANITLHWLAAFQWAVEAKDFNAVHRMAKEVGLQDMLQQPQKQGGVAGNITVVIGGGGASLDTPAVTVTLRDGPEEITEADYTVEGDIGDLDSHD